MGVSGRIIFGIQRLLLSVEREKLDAYNVGKHTVTNTQQRILCMEGGLKWPLHNFVYNVTFRVRHDG